MAETLEQFAKENSKFLRLENNETFTGKFVSYKIAPSEFDPEKEVVLYTLEAPTGRKVIWKTGSSGVAKRMGQLAPGSTITITRRGTGTQTQYRVTTDEDAPLTA